MSLKKLVVSIVSVSLVAGSSVLPVDAYQGSGRFKMFNAPEGAQYNIYKDNDQNYIYDDGDTLMGTLNCNADGVGYYNNLSEGYYVAVLQNEYPKLDTDKEYSFFSDGKSITSQEAYVSNNVFWNISYASSEDTISVSYDVPLYKQADSRWGSLKINGSSSTMKSVGCLITSFAMLRSYETNSEILPSQMMKTYSSSTGVGVVFSSGAAMSVPKSSANYGWEVYGYTSAYGGNGEISTNTKTNQTLLKVLYEKVLCGPVIFGGYSTYNGRGSSNHWIVVSGYSGDGVNFSASDFYVCDPGANRTTLDEYVSKYPYWDRIIYNPENTQRVEVTTTQADVTTTLIPNLITLPKQTTTNTDSTAETVAVTTTLIPDLVTLPKQTTTNTDDTTETTTVTTTTVPSDTTSIVIDYDSNIRLGDINEDGMVSQVDVYTLKRYLLSGETVTTFNVVNADMDGNGSVNLKDLNALISTLLFD